MPKGVDKLQVCQLDWYHDCLHMRHKRSGTLLSKWQRRRSG